MQRLKYKLVCTVADHGYQVGEVLTYSDAQQSYGGPWGWMQQAGCAEWQENLPTLADINADNNAGILQQITALEETLIRPLRELNSTLIADKSFAQGKVNSIEQQIKDLRAQLK